MIALQSTPLTNTTALRISLTRAGVSVATLDPGQSDVFTLQFDGLLIVNPGLPPRALSQTTLGFPQVQPGMLAFLETAPGYILTYARPGQASGHVAFA